MSYIIEFIPSSEKEFRKLDVALRKQFIEKLKERAENPGVPSAKLHGMKDCYKIKLRNAGYRLVYQVIDERIVVKVIAVGRRDRSFVYTKAKSRL
ncbi:putative plasmid stability protein StbE, addiction module antitoxin [Aggregatibacter actinomycetemcomitans serotype e str. SC1083]|uniref:Putative plasmid stability protein StbE, addiction module antitoxin n=1 Tax=Aggregatibacter actinomycetemcomitans serotype e str. SC1083 TaxID=907488 RepID=G4A803_AGGAC|nr:type II toxin-antitoxin system RelE/ParE family toxin [Aggregatibacter actinomycetemcomitans]EGY34557.1 putative plasmid stability protein StbE, addiction module antitoxin [Aggregatibacter actinomycetemcomitans serotype e str. SC1083]KYK76872.1 RelE toxin [Aggregatibacter actinomycetemcomitans serotype e str. SA3096]KYK77855.1 RelE toxin [Aggregatibacter actinomycetemcomitans serotype e str. SC936]KYK94893.1 RelE toxin [Aggregatibacter actinomycetemcomitans serotype e str. ANH9776]TYB22035.